VGRRSRRLVAFALVAAAFCVPASAQAYTFVLTDIINFDLNDSSWSTYGGGTQFHISSTGDGSASYRWVDDPAHTTIISGNTCADYSTLGSDTIAAHDTTYHLLFWGVSGQCFVLRGKTATGAGSMTNYDGRLRR
jgi:hypothetical protein